MDSTECVTADPPSWRCPNSCGPSARACPSGMTVCGATGCGTVSGGPGIRPSTGHGRTGGGAVRVRGVPQFPQKVSPSSTREPQLQAIWFTCSSVFLRRCGTPPSQRGNWMACCLSVVVSIRYEVRRYVPHGARRAVRACLRFCCPVNVTCAMESPLAAEETSAAARPNSAGAISAVDLRLCRSIRLRAGAVVNCALSARNGTDARETRPASRAELLSWAPDPRSPQARGSLNPPLVISLPRLRCHRRLSRLSA